MTAVIRPADARRSASVRRISSIRFSFGGVQIDWMMKQSPPRTFSRTSIITSPSGKRPTSASPIFTPRCCVTSRASAGFEFPVKTSSWSLTLSDIFSYPASRSSCDPSVLANHLELGWAGRIRTFECQVQSLVPYQLGDRPAHLDSKAQRPRISPSHFRETLKLTTGETPFGRSAGKTSNKLFGPNRRDPAPHQRRGEPARTFRLEQPACRNCDVIDAVFRCQCTASVNLCTARDEMSITGCRGHPCPRKRETHGGF